MLRIMLDGYLVSTDWSVVVQQPIYGFVPSLYDYVELIQSTVTMRVTLVNQYIDQLQTIKSLL